MGHSVQSYRGKHIVLSDAEIADVVGLLNTIVGDAAEGKAYRFFLDAWNEQFRTSGTGCLDLHFDELLSTLENRILFSEMIAFLREEISKYDKTIPMNLIGGQYVKKWFLSTRDIDVYSINNSINKIIDLVSL